MDHARARSDREDIVLTYTAGDCIDPLFGVTVGKHYKRVKTCNDGACAVHSVFGELHRGVYRHTNARQFLRLVVDKQIDVVRSKLRPDRMYLLDAVLAAFWTDLVLPNATRDANVRAPEEGYLLGPLQASECWGSIFFLSSR